MAPRLKAGHMISKPKNKISKGRAAKRALHCLLPFALGLVCLNSAAQAATQISAEKIAAYQAMPENERVRLLITLAKTHQSDDAAELIQHFPLQGEHAADRTLFITGLIKADHGDLTGAVQNYRDALADDPGLTLVRAELAKTLVALDEGDSAKHHLQLLEAEAPNETDAAGIKSFIDQIDANHPLKFNGYISIAPTTNMNNGSSHSTVYSPYFHGYGNIPVSQQKTSGVGLSTGVSVGYSKRLGNKLRAVVAGNVGAQIYKDSNFDSLFFSQSASLQYLLGKGYIAAGAVASQSIDPIARDVSYYSYGPRVSLVQQLTQRNSLNASSTFEWRNYGELNLQNGTASLNNMSLSHAIDQSFTFTVMGGYDQINAASKDVSYNTKYAGLSIYKELPMGITVNADIQARFSNFDEFNIITGVTRQDHRYIGSLELTKRDLNIMGFAPALSYTYTRNQSNVANFDYDSHAVDFRLTKNF